MSKMVFYFFIMKTKLLLNAINKIHPCNLLKGMMIPAIMVLTLLVHETALAQSNQTTIDLTDPNHDFPGYWSYNSATHTFHVERDVAATGTVNTVSAGLTFHIDAGATVVWEADATITTPVTAATVPSLVTLTGGGDFEVASTGMIDFRRSGSNTVTGGAIQVNGAGMTVTVNGTARSSGSGSAGNAILIAANGVTLLVNTGGTVESGEDNANAAVLIQNGMTGTKIFVDGGLIASKVGGYAISDGSVFTALVAGVNTEVEISGGAITAGTACAIRSAGEFSKVTVNGGYVSNVAGNNANPAIYMNGGTGLNVTVNGGTVMSASDAGYAIQTTGNVAVSGGTVSAKNGRAINLVGLHSVATVSSGSVYTTGTGTAISTATTDPASVAFASVAVTGGTVSSANGHAINITGENSTVTVSGGHVSTASANSSMHGISASGSNAQVTVGGGKVSANAGRAVQSSGSDASVTVGGGQVWATNEGNAIRCLNGTVTLSGGFVFAYGNNETTVISGHSVVRSSGSTALVTAWEQNKGVRVYPQFTLLSASNDPDLHGEYAYIGWYNDPVAGGGIYYDHGANVGFFPIPEVTVTRDYGLIFDATTGKMHLNITGSGVPGGSNSEIIPANYGNTWEGVTDRLTLKGLTWTTHEAVALTIYRATGNTEVQIFLEAGKTSIFTSLGTAAGSCGLSSAYDLSIDGDGVLNVSGGDCGIHATGGIELFDGTLTASGGNEGMNISYLTVHGGTVETMGAHHVAFSSATITLNPVYIYWTNTADVNPGVPGTIYTGGATGAYTYNPSDKYVKISGTPFAVVDDRTVSGHIGLTLSSPIPQTDDMTLYGVTVATAMNGLDVSDWFTGLPLGVAVTATAPVGASTITFTFGGMPLETSDAPFVITVPATLSGGAPALSGGKALHVLFNPDALFDIGPYPVTIRTAANGIFYVMQGGTGDGSSWANAYSNVADPLLLAAEQRANIGALVVAPDDTIREIWVAEGAYYPMHTAVGHNLTGSGTKIIPAADGGRDNAFVLVKDVTLYGGFPHAANDDDNAPHGTFTKADALATRSWDEYPAVLSGASGIAGNCCHIVIVAGDVGEAALDGFTVADGNASGALYSSCSVNGQTVYREYGGGIYVVTSSPALNHLTVSENSANTGGGIYVRNNSSPALTHVTVNGNTAVYGGGIYCVNSSPVLANVLISGNSASRFGGGIDNLSSPTVFTNVTVSGNSATENGGGVYSTNSSINIRNSIICGNTAAANGNFYNLSGSAFFEYSIVEGSGGSGSWNGSFGTDNGNNIDIDPQFVAAEPASAAPTVDGDYRLKITSPAIDAGNDAFFSPSAIPDLSAVTTDLDGNPRIIGDAVDMGVYETVTYAIVVIADPVAGGTVAGGGRYAAGENVTVTATEAPDYDFINWTIAGTAVSTSATYSFAAAGDATLTAHFALKTYTVTVTASPSAGGTVTGGGNYQHGDAVTVTASASSGYDFVNWTVGGSVVSMSDTLKFTATAPVALVANFVQTALPVYTVGVVASPAAGGTVAGGGTYHFGDAVTVAATTGTGYDFVNWTVGGTVVSTSAAYNFTVTGDVVLTANFAAKRYSVAVDASPAAGGAVAGGGTYNYGDAVTVTAVVGTGYDFVNWTVGGTVVSTSAAYNFTVTGDVALTANFARNHYTVAVAASPAVGGTVAGGGSYPYGAPVTVTAVAGTGYNFVNWTVGGTVVSTSATYNFTVTGDVALTANFTANLYTVAVAASSAVGGTVAGGGSYPYGDPVTVMAVASSEAYEFLYWTDDGGEIISTAPSYSFACTGDVALTAVFVLKTFSITVEASIGEGGTVAGGGIYQYGEPVTVTAAASSEAYEFLYWINGLGEIVSASPSYIFTCTGDATLTAVFEPVPLSGDTDIADVTVDDIPVALTGLDMYATAPCGSSTITVTVTAADPQATVRINGTTQNPCAVALPDYGDNFITITVCAPNGDEQDYALTVTRLIPFEQVATIRWNNTLSVVNNPANNGGFSFVAFRWFRDGQEFSTAQWWSAGAKGETIDADCVYQIEMTTTDGRILRTCPHRITLRSMEVKAYPTPVVAGQTLYVDADVDEELLQDAFIEVYSLSGVRVGERLQVEGRLTPIRIRYPAGVYLFVLKGGDGYMQTMRVTVK